MNNDKLLSTKEIAGGMTAGISLRLGGPAIAFLTAAVIAGVLGAPFTVVFYSIWALVSLIGIVAIAGGIKASVDKHKSITS